MFKGSDKDYLQNARDSVKKGLADEVINTIDHDHPYKLKILNPHHHSYYNPRNMSGKIENNLLNIAQHQQIKAKVKNIIKSGKTDNIKWNDDDIHKKYRRFRLYKNLLDNNKSNKSFKSITEKWKDKINLNTNRD